MIIIPRMQTFDPNQELCITNRRLPHWAQAGTITFITWRTWDSLPKQVIAAWLAERDFWLQRHGIDPASPNWSQQVDRLGTKHAAELRTILADRWNDQLDASHGDCVLRRPELAAEVATSLQHFDNDRYELIDYVIMPNHVHLLAAFLDESALLKQCDSWKHFTATQINRRLQRSGRFWQQDGFDHLVRSPEQFAYLRGYIAANPERANLRPGEYLHYSKPLGANLHPLGTHLAPPR
jgi:putative transposase